MDPYAEFPNLLSPIEIAGLKLEHRIIMPPMATAMAVGSDQFLAWYQTRARGGAALIIMEAMWANRLCEDELCEALEPTVAAIRAEGVPVVLQIFMPPVTESGEPIAPSASHNGRAATEDELAAMPAMFAEASARCREMGFDGVEPHGAHGFFLNQMLSPLQNRRDDRYGGSLEKRMALGLEIVAAIRGAMGDDYPIFYRHTMEEPDGYTAQDSLQLIGGLIEAGVNTLDISPSTPDIPPRSRKQAVETDDASESCDVAVLGHGALAAMVKREFDVPVIAVGQMEEPLLAETALEHNKCDLCAVGRQLIADADFPNKLIGDRMDEVIRCTKCSIQCFGNLRKGVPIGCTENPASGNEYKRRGK